MLSAQRPAENILDMLCLMLAPCAWNAQQATKAIYLPKNRYIRSAETAGPYTTRRSHRVSLWIPSQFRSQYGTAHFRHL
jgi:hypothetical protein